MRLPIRLSGLAGLLLLVLGAGTGQAATVYRWVDAEGRVHYGQTPPARGEAQALQTREPRPASPPVAAPAPVEPGRFLQQAEERRAAEQAARQEEARRKAESAQRCSEARTRLAALEEATPRRLLVTTAEGQSARMTEEEWNRRRQQAADAIAADCSPALSR